MARPKSLHAPAAAVATAPATAPMPRPTAVNEQASACLLHVAQIRRRRSRAVHILVAIFSVLFVLELGVGSMRMQQYGEYALQLLFPSQDVTSTKVLCLVGGIALSFYYLVVATSHRHCRKSLSLTAATTHCASSSARTLSPHSATKSLAVRSSLRPHSYSADACELRLTSPPISTVRPTLLLPASPAIELPQLTLTNELQTAGISTSSRSSRDIVVNGKDPIAFENDLFKGHLLFLVRDSTAKTQTRSHSQWRHLFRGRKRTLWVQVQGQFKRAPAPDTTLFVAAELASPLVLGFWTRKLIDVLAALVKKMTRSAHIALGDDGDTDALPHAAFPVVECADEFVETPVAVGRAPALGGEHFGETQQQRDARLRSTNRQAFALDHVYTFQCYTMFADVAQWQIANLPGLPEIPLRKLVGDQPIRFAAYMAPDDGSAAHTSVAKDYVFCFAVRYNEDVKRARAASVAHASLTPLASSNLSLSNRLASSTSSVESATAAAGLCSPTASSLRRELEQVSDAADKTDTTNSHADTNCVNASALPQRLAQHEHGLRNLRFTLPVWIEQVDRVAGNRKVSYLFSVEEEQPLDATNINSGSNRPAVHRYTVVRSAATIKNALLLLRDADVDDTSDVTPLSPTRSSAVGPAASRSHDDAFRKLLVESREFLYETITSETTALAAALQRIASSSDATTSPSQTRRSALQRAMLFHCLKSPGALPRVRVSTDIGVQLPRGTRERLDIICESGVFRAHAPQLLRQEWLLLTTSDVRFIRSFAVRACKTLAITDVLHVRTVDTSHVLQPLAADTSDGSDVDRATSNVWFCVELHCLCEVVTVFFDAQAARQQFVASLTQLMLLRARPGLLQTPPLALETQTLPRCLNRRNVLEAFSSSNGSSSVPTATSTLSPHAVVQDALRKGLVVYAIAAAERRASDLLPFLDAVEQLADVVLPGSDDAVVDAAAGSTSASTGAPPFTHEEKLAFALNLYHVLYIHATLVFGAPTTTFEWHRMQRVPCYDIGRAPHVCMRVTLEVIEHELLRVDAGASAANGPAGSSRGLLRARASSGSSSSSSSSSARRLLSLGKSNSNSSSGASASATPPPPRHLAITHADFRTSFALQLNCRPGATIMCVYNASSCIHEQLNAACAAFLARELRVDVVDRVVALPRLVEWRQHDLLPRSLRTDTGSNGSAAALRALAPDAAAGYDVRAFICLQKLLGFLDDAQRERVQRVLRPGTGKSGARIVYDPFWTTQSISSNNSSNTMHERNIEHSSGLAGTAHDVRASSKSDASDSVLAVESATTTTTLLTTPTRGGSARQFLQSLF